MPKIKLRVPGLSQSHAQAFEDCARQIVGVYEVDTWPNRAEIKINEEVSVEKLVAHLRSGGFDAHVRTDGAGAGVCEVQIGNMTCRSCELTVERRFKKIPGVRSVTADAVNGRAKIVFEPGHQPSVESLDAAVRADGYRVGEDNGLVMAHGPKPSFWRVVGVFAAVGILSWLFSELHLVDRLGNLGGREDFWAALVLGLIAGSSSCLAVSGGLLLSSAARFNAEHAARTATGRMLPSFVFVVGRTLSYGLFGGLIGLVGKSLIPSPGVIGLLLVVAAAFMIVMGLEMLDIAPRWLVGILPRMPKFLGRLVMSKEDGAAPLGPFLLGALTFFLPCGFTQSLQIYALTTGSFWHSATVLSGFAIGTAPMLLVLGWASNAIKGKAGVLFKQMAGALAVILGLWTLGNATSVSGFTPVVFQKPAGTNAEAAVADQNVVMDGETQVIKLRLIEDPPYYAPSGRFTVKAGQPVRIEVDGQGYGCRSIFQVPQYGVRMPLDKDVNVAEFTPTQAGQASFSCAMGMYRGSLDIVTK